MILKKQPKKIISKILKLDENNQYGFGMTKPLPTGCIKTDPNISFKKLNDLIRTLDINSPFGHLYTLSILNLIMKMQLKIKLLIMEFILQLLKNKKYFIHVKDLFINYLSNI